MKQKVTSPLAARPLALGALILVLFWSFALSAIGAPSPRILLPGHVPKAVANLRPIGSLPSTTNLFLSIGLPLRNQSKLDELLRELQDPRSTNFHRYLTPQQFTDRFGPTEEQYHSVIQFAQSNGFTVVGTHSNRVVLDVEAGVTDLERAFRITLRTYGHPTESRDFYAPDTEPSVPADLPVIDIEGLSDFARPRPMLRPAKSDLIRPLIGSGPSGYFAGTDFRNAYVPGTSLTGAGQMVGLLEFSAYFQSDITNYENTIGLSRYVPLANVVVGHGTPSTSNNDEVALDIEVAISMAPGLAQVIVYEENSVNPGTILSRMANDNLTKQLSCSWSWGGGPSSTVDNIFQQMAAQGQSFFQSSGDGDAYTGGNLLDDVNQAVAPMDSPYITVVGGTTLNMNGSGGSWSSESVWNYHSFGGATANTGSGGGISRNYSIPSWQTNVSMASNGGSTIWRNIPDVALTGDQVYVAYNNGSSGGFAGTSCAAPLWAGFCALINEQSAASGGPPVGFLNPALYAIANSSSYNSCFHDVTVGNNIGTNTPGLFNATTGYDLCTGLGTPNGTNLINALVPYPFTISQSNSQTVTNGATVLFSVNAGGQLPLIYQWWKDGAKILNGGNVSGATSNLLTLTSVTTGNSGNYTVVVSNNYGSVTGSVATLTVTFPPSFTTQPTNQTIATGGNAVLTASATGASPLNYQWWKDGVSLSNTSNVSGATSNVLSLTAVTTANAGSYSLVAANSYGPSTSAVAVITVTVPPTISVPPAAQTIQCGGNVLFSVSASGTPPLNYQWTLDGTNIPGANGTNLSLTGVHPPDHTVGIIVTSPYGSASSNATLTVQDTAAPVVTLNGSNLIYVELGNSFSDLGATALDACAGVLPVNISGTVNTNAVGTNTLTYSASDGNGNTGTTIRNVIIRDTTPPTIQWSFTNLVLAADASCTASLPDLTQTNSILATDLSEPLTISQDPTNGASFGLGTHSVVLTVQDAVGNKSFSTNSVVVQDQTPPLISNPPLSQTNDASSTAFFGLTATACSPIAYQWYFNDALLSQQTNNTLTVSNLNATLAGNYFVVATAAGGSSTSAVAVLTVNLLSPSLTLNSSENPAGFNDSLNFIATLTPASVSGTVQFLTNSSAFDSEPLTAGTATSITNTALPRGTNIITAIYPGDSTYRSVTNTLAQVITNHPPTAIAFFANRYTGFPLQIPLTSLATNWSDADGDVVSLLDIGMSTNGVTIVNQNGTLAYTNSNDVNDVFVCTIGDGWGGTNYQSVSISVIPLPLDATPSITSVQPGATNLIHLQLAGNFQFAYILQTTTDLTLPDGWVSITTNTPDTNGVWGFSDTITNGPIRFYRLKLAQ